MQNEEMQFPSLGQDDPLREEMATHSSIPAWRSLGTEKPGRLQATVHGVSKGQTCFSKHVGEVAPTEVTLPQSSDEI